WGFSCKFIRWRLKSCALACASVPIPKLAKPCGTLSCDFGFAALAAGPALPHAELEYREIGRAQQGARHDHDISAAHTPALLERQALVSGLDLRRVGPAPGGHQPLHRPARPHGAAAPA